MVAVKGCHMVGSVPLPDTESVLRRCCQGLPNRLRRVPDGETGSRNWFTYWQSNNVFSKSPLTLAEFVNNEQIQRDDFTPAEMEEGIAKLKAARPLLTGYDTVAIESYQVFKKLRAQGVVDPGTKFLVSLPTTANVLAPFVQYVFQPAAEPIYEEALFQAMRNLQDEIPHEDLAIQIDLAVDTAFWEGVPIYKPWWEGEVHPYIVAYIARMMDQVDTDVEVGIHNCYGDMEHHHWFEPTSLAAVTSRATQLLSTAKHPLNFMHFPVPLSALGFLDDYFAPLTALLPTLKANGTELIIGCVHFEKLDATRKMIEAAKRVEGMYDFSVSTECGMGRTPPEQVDGLLALSREVAEELD